MTELLVGRISSINYAAGTARIIFQDHDAVVTPEIPFLAAEYQMPETGQLVFVLRADKARLILGRAWSDSNKPAGGRAGIYHKALGQGAALQYDAATGEAVLSAPSVRITESGSSSTIREILDRLDAAEAKLKNHERRISENESRLSQHAQRIGVNEQDIAVLRTEIEQNKAARTG